MVACHFQENQQSLTFAGETHHFFIFFPVFKHCFDTYSHGWSDFVARFFLVVFFHKKGYTVVIVTLYTHTPEKANCWLPEI